MKKTCGKNLYKPVCVHIISQMQNKKMQDSKVKIDKNSCAMQKFEVNLLAA